MAGKKKIGKTVFFGLLSIALYAALIAKQDLITEHFTKGGFLYAFLPILTAFLFSFVHGSFTGGFWSALGVEASKKHHKEAK